MLRVGLRRACDGRSRVRGSSACCWPCIDKIVATVRAWASHWHPPRPDVGWGLSQWVPIWTLRVLYCSVVAVQTGRSRLWDSGETAGRLTLHARISDSQWLQGGLSLQLFWVAVGGGWRGMGPNGNAPRAAERLCAVECGRGCARTGLASQDLRLVARCPQLSLAQQPGALEARLNGVVVAKTCSTRYSVHQHSPHTTSSVRYQHGGSANPPRAACLPCRLGTATVSLDLFQQLTL